MEKIKKWRQVLIAALSVLFATTMLAAVFMIAPYKAFAEATLTLPENTAKYTITKVDNYDRYNIAWSYDADSNIWSISYPFRTDNSSPTKLTATVEQGGKVAFEYLIEAAFDETSSLMKEQNIAQSRFVFTVTSPEENGGETKTYYGTFGEFKSDEFQYVSFDVKAGDIITFSIDQKLDLNSNVGVRGYLNWYLHGLGGLSEEIAAQYAPELQTVSLSEVMPIAEGIPTPTETGTWNKDTEGEYYVYPQVHSLTSTIGWSSNLSEYTLTYQVNGRQEISFKYWYWARMHLIESSLYNVNMFESTYEGSASTGELKFYFDIKINGNTVIGSASDDVNCGFIEMIDKTDSSYTQLNEEKILPEQYREWKEYKITTTNDGVNTISFTFKGGIVDFNTGSMKLLLASAFGIKDISFKEISMKSVTFPAYESRFGTLYHTVSGVKTEIPSIGETVQVPEGAEITLTAETKTFARSSKVNYVAVRPYFCVNGAIQANNSYTFTADDDNKNINYSFTQQAPKPIVWAQILDEEKNEEGEAFLASPSYAIEIPGTGNPTLRLFLADYKDLGGTYTVKINGQTAMCEDVSGRTEIHLPAQLADSKVYLTAQANISENLEIEVIYSVEGVEAHSVTFRTKFVVGEVDGKITQQTIYSTNIYNNLFTEDSEQGAYFTSQAGATDVALWHSASSAGENFAVETDSDYFGFHREQANGIGAPWKNSLLTLQLETGKSGLVMFELQLSGKADNTNVHAAAILISALGAMSSLGEYLKPSNIDPNVWTNGHIYGGGSLENEQWKNYTGYTRLLAPTADGGAKEFSSRLDQERTLASVTPLGDGWFRVVAPTKATVSSYYNDGTLIESAEANFNRFTLAFVTEAGYDASLKVRNVTFINATDVTVEAKSSTDEGTVSTEGLSDGKTAAFGSTVKFTADVPDSKKLYGWSVATKKNGATVSETFYPVSEDSGNTFEYFAVQSAEVTAWIADPNTYHVYLGGTLYASLGDALTAAAKDTALYKTVTALDSFAVEDAVTIPQGVTFLIPYNSAGQFTKMGGDNRIAWKNGINPYLTVTLNGAVTVNGSLNVGGVFSAQGQAYQGHTSGEYAELVLNGAVTVNNGGTLNVYGRVTGTGSITAKSGGKVYQPFLILDFAGGTNTLGLFTAGQTPFKRYAMINIECPLTIEYGAQLIGHASLYAAGMYVSLDQPFISDENGDGNGNDTFIMLKNGAKVTITYDPEKVVNNATAANGTEGIGKTTMTFTGGADFSYMLFSAMGVSIRTNGVDFSIPYNYEIQLASGDFATKTKFKLMPGSIVHVQNGAKLTLNADAYVYDGLVQSGMSGKRYPTAAELKENNYYSTNANLIVDGTLILKKDITFTGVVQTTGSTGKITIEEGVTLKKKIVDGARTGYDCNYAEYESSMRLYDKVHGENGQGTLTEVLPEGREKTTSKLEFSATWTEADNQKTWTLKGVQTKYEASNGQAHGSDNHLDLETTTLTDVSGMVGSWMVEHEDHTFDWSQLSDEEKNLGAGKYKDLHRQCTELGCADEEHKLLLSENFTLKGTYKGSEFRAEDLVKLFYQYYFGSEEVPAELANCKFTASVNAGSGAIQNAATYNGLTVALTNGFFGDVSKNDATFTFTVEKFDVKDLDQAAIEQSLSGLVYNGTAQTPELTLRAEGLTGSVDHAAFEWSNNTNAGENTARVTIKGSGQNFEGELTVNFSIKKAALTVEVVSKTKPYDGKAWSNVENAAQGTDFKIAADGKIYNSDDLGLALTVGSAGADVGSYTVTGVASNTNYDVTVTEGTYTITRAPLTVTIASKSHTYGEKVAELSYTLDGVVGEEEEAIKSLISLKSDGAEQWADAAKYNIKAWYDGSEIKAPLEATSNDVLKNYTVTVSGGENAYTVARKSIAGEDAKFSVTTAYTYDGTAKTPTMSDIKVTWEEYAEKITAQKESFTPSYSNNTDAGDATVTLTASGNFEGTVTIHFTIAKATLEHAEITTDTKNFTYNGQAHTVALKVTTANGVEIPASEYTVKYDDNVNAGTVTVTVTVNAESTNFADKSGVTATFAIAKAKVTVKADDQTTPQNEQILSGDALTWQVTAGQFFGSDKEEIAKHFSVTTNADSKEVNNEGFTITIDWSDDGYGCKNYTVTFVSGKYYIIDAIFKSVTVTGQGTVEYDGEVHTLKVEVNNEDLNGKTTVTITTKDGETFEGATNAGTYVIHVNIKATGYQTEYNSDFTLTIEQVKVTVTFGAQSMVYGETPKGETALTYTVSEGVLPKDQETFDAAIAAAKPHTDATSTSAVGGSYTITADKPVLANYEVTIVDGVYTITARAVEVTVNKQTVTYNQAQQSALSRNGTDWSVTNLAAHEQETPNVLNIKLEATGENAGAYDITATWNNANYAVTFKGAEGLEVENNKTVKEAFVIEAAELSGAQLTSTHTYNGQAQTPTFTVTAGELTVAEGDFELVYADGADRVSAGTVQVTVVSKSGNYTGKVETQFTIAAKKIQVTLQAQSFEYSGEIPTPANDKYTVDDSELCSKNGEKDDLGVVITLIGGNKNVGEYGLTATASNTDYVVTFDATAKLSITKKHITVKANDLTSIYGDDLMELTYTATGLVEGDDPETELHITLQPERTIKEAGTYKITGSGSAANYAFDGVEEGTYTVSKRGVTIKIHDQSALYDGKEPTVLQEQGEGWTVVSGNIIDGDNLHIVLTKAEGVNADKYAINGAFENDNYQVTFEGTMETAGAYTVTPRAVTVEIGDQGATYDPEKAKDSSYAFDAAAWSIVANLGDGLASGEDGTALGIVLSVGKLEHAGAYVITGTSSNANYDVTFTGNYNGEDENKGKAGVYTIAKLDVSEDVIFILLVGEEGDEGAMEGDRTVRVKYAGKPLPLSCEATLYMGETKFELVTVLDHTSIDGEGNLTVVVTIEDTDYCGGTEFVVIVTDANGYTEHLKDVLALLQTLVEGLDKEALKAEDYGALVKVYEALESLDEAEQEVGAAELATYREYVDAWEALADIEDVVETAKAVADAPIEALFEAAAVLTALAGLAYIAFKGGLL